MTHIQLTVFVRLNSDWTRCWPHPHGDSCQRELVRIVGMEGVDGKGGGSGRLLEAGTSVQFGHVDDVLTN